MTLKIVLEYYPEIIGGLFSDLMVCGAIDY